VLPVLAWGFEPHSGFAAQLSLSPLTTVTPSHSPVLNPSPNQGGRKDPMQTTRLWLRAKAVAPTRSKVTVRTGIVPYFLFVKQCYGNKTLRAHLQSLPTIGRKGKQIRVWFNELPQPVLEKLKKQAAKVKVRYQRRPKGSRRVPRKPTAWTRFIQQQMKKPSIRKLPFGKRVKAIAKIYKKSKK
jgi:hypothetical protein